MSVRKIERASSACDYPLLIKKMLRHPLIHTPNQEIVYQSSMRYDYTTFRQRIARLANALEKLGVEQGNIIGIMDWDSHRYLEAFFAIPMMGSVLHTVNIRRSPEHLLYTVNHAENSLLLVHEDFLPLLESVRDKLNPNIQIILLSDKKESGENLSPLTIAGEYENLLAQSSTEYSFPEFEEDAVATLIYTTASAGLPKGVCFTHRQIVLHTFGIMSALCAYQGRPMCSSGDVYMPLTPMFQVHAWGMPFLFTFLGAKQVYPGKYEPEKILKLVAAEGVTVSHCDPTFLHTLLNCPAIKNTDVFGWKIAVGGAPLPESVCRTALDYGINLCSTYGMTETGPLLAMANLKSHMVNWKTEKQIRIRCRTGLPAPLVDLDIVDILGTPLPHDGKSIGEVVVRSPWLSQGYFKDPAKSEKLWSEGWLHTGDIGFVDTEGYLQITDRFKDSIKTGGEWVASVELEDIIGSHEAVSEAAVTAVPDEKLGEKPIAFVVLKKDFADSISEADIRAFCEEYVKKGALPAYAIPDKIVITESIPKTGVGKISKRQMRHEFQNSFHLDDGP